jgi:hypothetical protein
MAQTKLVPGMAQVTPANGPVVALVTRLVHVRALRLRAMLTTTRPTMSLLSVVQMTVLPSRMGDQKQRLKTVQAKKQSQTVMLK